jgi:hypothetical protein
VAPVTTGDRPACRRSSALRALLEGLRDGSRHDVLDLGPPLARNVEVLSSVSRRVRIADLHRSLAAEGGSPGGTSGLLERILPLGADERFAGVLAWDVFDYMKAPDVSALMARLAPACLPGALALVLVSTGREIPAVPPRYRIVPPDGLEREAPPGPMRPCPRHTPHHLGRMMPGFSIRQSLLLRDGVRECLFVRGDGKDQGPDRGLASPQGGAWFRRVPV